tara:strand:- start:82 stop:903 length:822 start_codon:yes stop_codon:yes gene_type:complete
MRNWAKRSIFLGLLLGVISISYGQSKVAVGILGVHHFHNPGADMFNIHQDDIKAPQRQKEVLELVGQLLEFQPTKVVIEKAYGDTIRQKRYLAFLDHLNEEELSANEIEQVGFRIAAKLYHKALYPFDYRQGMDLKELEKLAESDPKVGAKFQGMMQEVGGFIQGVNDTLQKSTMSDFLSYMNSQESVDLNHQLYLRMLQMTGGNSYGASQGVTEWYGRNIRMFYNLNRIADFDAEGERILIIVGQGHKAILQDLIEDAPYYEYIDILDYIDE